MYCSHQEKIWANAQDITFLKAIRGQTHEKPECHEHCSTSMCLIKDFVMKQDAVVNTKRYLKN